MSTSSGSTYCIFYDERHRMCYRLLVGESSPWRAVVEKTITKEANLESDCQERLVLDRWSRSKASDAGKNKQKNSKVEIPQYIGRHTFMDLHFF